MKFVPYPYQQYCIDRIISDPAIGLFLDMGLGKTAITLSAIKDLRYNRWEVSKPLIIAPKKVAEATWTTEAAKWDQLKMMRSCRFSVRSSSDFGHWLRRQTPT